MSWCVFVWWCLMIGGVGWIECFEGFGSSWFFRSCVLQTNTEAHQRKERDSGHLDKLSESGACRELVQRYGVKHIKTNEQWNIQILKRRMNFCLQCYCSPVTLWFPSSNCQVGANKNQAMRNGLTPLMAACLQGHEEAGAQSSLEKSRFWAFFSYLAVFGVPPIFRHTHNIHIYIYTHVYIRIYIYIYIVALTVSIEIHVQWSRWTRVGHVAGRQGSLPERSRYGDLHERGPTWWDNCGSGTWIAWVHELHHCLYTDTILHNAILERSWKLLLPYWVINANTHTDYWFLRIAWSFGEFFTVVATEWCRRHWYELVSHIRIWSWHP